MSNFAIKKDTKFGRFAISKEDIQPGCFILDEYPFAVGPKARNLCCCLECNTLIDGTATGSRCEKCSWPICEDCSKLTEFISHKRECEIFESSKAKFYNLPDPNATCIQLDCITPLRVLLEREANMERWTAEVEPMEDHREKRINSDAWNADQQNIVGYLLGPCKLRDHGVTEELIQKIIGILEVNAFEAKTLNGNFVRCLYPKFGMLSHSCVPNTTHSIHPSDSFKLTVRSTVAIKKDSQLYSCYTYPLVGTLERQQHLVEGKYFKCDCERCLDPTELGTHFSSLKCQNCLHGDMNSLNPLDANAFWKCNKCSLETPGETIKETLRELKNEIDCTSSIEFLEESLEEYEGILHPNHYMLTSMKSALIDGYGHINGYFLSELPDILLRRKIDLCEELLAILNVFKSGMSRARAIIMYEQHAPLVLYAKSQYDIGNLTKDEYLEQLEKARDILTKSQEILEWEDENICLIVSSARKSQESLDKLINSLMSD